MSTGNHMIDGDSGEHPQSPKFKEVENSFSECPYCEGEKEIPDEEYPTIKTKCVECGGTGVIEVEEEDNEPDPDEDYDTRFED